MVPVAGAGAAGGGGCGGGVVVSLLVAPKEPGIPSCLSL